MEPQKFLDLRFFDQQNFGPNILFKPTISRSYFFAIIFHIDKSYLTLIGGSLQTSRLLYDYLKAVLRLLKRLQDFLKTIHRLFKDYFKSMLKITSSYLYFIDKFKDNFKTTKLISTQLGTTQPQLVFKIILLECPFCFFFTYEL